MIDPNVDQFLRAYLKTRHMILLQELGKHGSILHAAQATGLTQPAASKMLSELESTLGVQLFERLPRGIAPTQYGEVMIRRAGVALAEMGAGYQELLELQAGWGGRVTMGTILAPATGLVPDAIVHLKKTHKRVQVSVSADTSKLMVQRLRTGQLDLVVGRILDGDAAVELSFEPLMDEPHRIITRSGHPLAQRADISLADLAREAWVVPPSGSILRDKLTAMFISEGLDPPVQAVETLAPMICARLLVTSDMIAALPCELVQPFLDSGQLVALTFDIGLRMDVFGIITRKNHQLSPGALAMIDSLRFVANGGAAAQQPE